MNDKLTVMDMTKGAYRRVYAGFLHSRKLNSVSIEAEAWFWRLHAIADDFGNLRVDVENLRVEASPKRKVTTRQVSGWLSELEAAGLIRLYTVEGDDFAHIEGFVEMQPEQKGRNGKGRRVRRVPEWAGESGCTLDHPGSPGHTLDALPICTKPHHHHNQDHNHHHHQQDGGAGGGLVLTPEGEAGAASLSKRPDWLKSELAWLTLEESRELVRLGLPPDTYTATLRLTKGKRANLRNPAGFFISELKKAASMRLTGATG